MTVFRVESEKLAQQSPALRQMQRESPFAERTAIWAATKNPADWTLVTQIPLKAVPPSGN
jgi:hypothetical protein